MGFEIYCDTLIKYKEEDNITDITILDGVTSIAGWAFCHCIKLKSIIIK